MRFLGLALVLLLVACSSRDGRGRPIDDDGGGVDAARRDAAGTDAARTDAGDDAGGADGGRIDAGPGDAGTDAGALDGGPAPGPDGCVPPTSDTSAIGTSCTSAADCPSGYVCQPFIGIVLQQTCEIRCETACCPSGTTCQMVADKAGTWLQCNPT